VSHAAGSATGEQQLSDEVVRLRERVAALEIELFEVQAQANKAVAEWQDRAYWLDRWHLDLNALMLHPGADRVRALLRALRAPVRIARRAVRGVRS
jgi:hypothetical protein